MTNLLAGIFDIVIGGAMILIFLRFMLQFAGLTGKDAAAKPIYRLTRIVDVFGRIFPTVGEGRINTATLVLMLLLRLIFIWGVVGMQRLDSQNIGLFMMPDVNLAMIKYLSQHFSPVMMFFVAGVTLLIDFLKNSVSETIKFLSLPIPSISTTTSSPGTTSDKPSGVPVAIMSPGFSVINDEIYSIKNGTLKIMSAVVPS